MLKIRPAQLRAFRPATEAAFEQRIADYLREEHAGEVVQIVEGEGELKEVAVRGLDDETLLEMVRTGIARARSYGMTWESSITSFVVLMFVIAPNFDSHPLIKRALRAGGVEPDQTIDLLMEQTTDDNWETARQAYDAAAWHDDL